MSSSLPEHIQTVVDTIAGERRLHEIKAGPVQRAVNRVTRAVARPRFLVLIASITVAWVVFNLTGPLFGYRAFDPPPFPVLANSACLLALAVTVLILITQRHENELGERRDELTLQLAILNEQKTAKALQLLDDMRRDLPSLQHAEDPTLAALTEPADPVNVLEALRDSAGGAEGGVINRPRQI